MFDLAEPVRVAINCMFIMIIAKGEVIRSNSKAFGYSSTF